MSLSVVYWRPTRPGCQNRKCTCVNNRCIRSRNIRITWTVDGLNVCDLWRSQEEEWVLNYYITRCTGSSTSWWPDQLERRCGRQSQHLAEWALGPPIEQLQLERCGRESQHPAPSRVGPQALDWAVAVGEKMLEWGTCPRDAGPLGPRVSSLGERERNAVMANRVGVNMLQFCSVFNSLSHTTLSHKVRGIFF